MDVRIFIICVIFVVIGELIGIKIANIHKPKPVGILQVYVDDNPDEPPYLFLDLDESVSVICNSKDVIFRVNINHVDTRE